MPVEPVPCLPDGGGGTPGACNCSPSIATTPMCRADGSTVLLVVRSPCTTCGATAQAPVAIGWIDPLTGVFTPGTAPADAGPCEAPGCLDTLCRQRCDDTDGDGAPDATYSELWCIHADGSAELVLTYQDDPSVPYTPVAPVDCTYGCPESETVTLCDDSGPFLRRYTWLDGTATYVDVALDGTTPHVVTGTVGVCDSGNSTPGASCAEQTTPAATVGLCLADGTPIAVVITRDCDTDTVTQNGWVNLTTGTFSAGAPPAGAMACGDSRAFDLAGLLCDVDPATDEVLGLVLVEYEYNPDGSLASVRLVDPGTGTTYTLQGELRYCPAGSEPAADLDLTVLCDVQADGTAVPFLRDYRRDPATGQINGHTDYGLDGTPYVVTGTVDTCTAEAEPCGQTELLTLCDTALDGTATPFLRRLTYDCDGTVIDSADTALDGATPYAITGTVGQCTPPCSNTTSVLLCDLPEDGDPDPTITDTDPTPYHDIAGTSPVAGGAATLWAGGILSIPPDTTTAPDGFPQRVRSFAALVQAPRPGCDTGLATVTASIRVQRTGPDDGCGGTGRFQLLAGGTSLAIQGVSPSSVPVGTVQTLTLSAQVPAADLAAGDVALFGLLETYHRSPASCPGGSNPDGARIGGWTVDEFTADVVYDQTGCDPQFIRSLTVDCETGQVTAVTDTTLDGAPYTVTGEPGQCIPASTSPPSEPCRNSSSLLLCDLPTGGTPDPTVTDTDPTPYYPFPVADPVEGAQALWDGSTLDLPPGVSPQPGTTGRVNSLAAIIQAPRPDCDTGTAHVAVTLNVQQTGPDDGCGPTGHLRIFNGTTQIALTALPANTPAGYFGTLTVETDVPAADLAAGNIAFALALDAYDDSGGTCPGARSTGWQLSAFTAAATYDQDECDTQFLRTVTVDCDTGTVVAVEDTTLDGEPYTPSGEVGQCAAAGGECCPPQEPCGDTEVEQLCDLTYDPQAPIPTPARDFALTGNVVAANDGTTLWFAQANQEANGVAELIVGGLLPTVMYEFRFSSAWIGAGNPDPANNNAIYLLEILDGTTVLASRTRNVSNGSNVFPGGVLTEDLPPVAFIAPATGAVTIRFTDQTTGGPVNDRDLFLMPLEVRTAALTITRTPFLRRFTFDCDGGLTSTQDLGLDGATPYVVQGEVGQCTADGATTGAITPCDVQNVIEACRCDDADGDGVPEVGYVELLAVDCTGTLSSVGTYLPDYSAPYTPVAPMDCDAGEDLGAEPAFGVQAHRTELASGASWSADAWPTLQSVTAVAHGGTGLITTAEGASTLHPGEAATWSVGRDTDARLTGPLVIAADTGTVTITYTTGVQL
ncbi:hypothetical protein [Streptomyces sp. NPDC018693]|uniref:hypothetical protein n=1 Tax=unclassified Streptomyces TaxID=2593676 RepID=UPI00379550F5